MRAKVGLPKLRIISWNMMQSAPSWAFLLSSSVPDIVLLQEAIKPKDDVCWSVPALNESWRIKGNRKEFCAAIVGLTDRYEARLIEPKMLGEEGAGKLAVSLLGTLSAAEAKTSNHETILLVSAYSTWEYSFPDKKPIFADASAHRLISDLSKLINGRRKLLLIVAGDWNILYGYGENGDEYWKDRYNTVFARMETIGVPFVGPQYPGGTQADPWPSELPRASLNVPTFRTKRNDPSSATRQLDFVFASRELHNRLEVRALNRPEEWGPSDHCRIEINLW
jgi:hypothetical protein